MDIATTYCAGDVTLDGIYCYRDKLLKEHTLISTPPKKVAEKKGGTKRKAEKDTISRPIGAPVATQPVYKLMFGDCVDMDSEGSMG